MRMLPFLPLTLAANHYCEFNVPASLPAPITRVSGKMNVPRKPAVEPGKVLFLWPGVNPYGGQGGMMQPVLTYGANYGQGERVWGMANWFTNCDKAASSSGYCHDAYQPVDEGDTLSFSMQFLHTFANGSNAWQMSWSSAKTGRGSNFTVFREAQPVRRAHPYSIQPLEATAPLTRRPCSTVRVRRCLWATEAEFYLDSSDPANYAKLPRDPFYTWELRVDMADGTPVPLEWEAHGDTPGDVRVDCNWRDGDDRFGTKLTMPTGNDTRPAIVEQARRIDGRSAMPVGSQSAEMLGGGRSAPSFAAHLE